MVTRWLAKPRPVQGEAGPVDAARRGPGTPLEPPGDRRPRWMAIHDRIRLTGLLTENPAICRVFLFMNKPQASELRLHASPVHHAGEINDFDRRKHRHGRRPCAAWLGGIRRPPTPTRVGSERRLLNEQDDRAEPPSNQRDVRVELVARSGLFGCDATRSCNSCRCGRAVDSAQRFRSSSIARTPWARPLVPARRRRSRCRAPGMRADEGRPRGVGTCSPPTRSLWRDSTSRLGAPVGVNSPTL